MCHVNKISYPLFALSLFIASFSVFADNPNYHYSQIKIGMGVFNTQSGTKSAPIVSIGKRFELDDSALEISAGYGQHKHDNEKFSYFSLPKITYVKFHQPSAPSGFFYGGGLSFSQVKNASSYYFQTEDNKFTGAFAEGTLGYEFKRNAAISPILYVDVSQGIVAQSKEGRHPGPSVMVGISAGF
ncbi:MAG: hypothetical protein AB7V32_10140 [Candidatus Berkiella sp.]